MLDQHQNGSGASTKSTQQQGINITPHNHIPLLRQVRIDPFSTSLFEQGNAFSLAQSHQVWHRGVGVVSALTQKVKQRARPRGLNTQT